MKWLQRTHRVNRHYSAARYAEATKEREAYVLPSQVIEVNRAVILRFGNPESGCGARLRGRHRTIAGLWSC